MSATGKILLPMAVAAALVGLLFATLDVPASAITDALSRFDTITLLAITGCTAAFVSLSALKWLLVHNTAQARATHDRLHWQSAIYLTGMGAALSIFVIPQVAVLATRSVGSKYGLGKSASGAAAATAYEQLFDLVPLGVMAVTTLVALALGWGSDTWLATTIVALGLAAAGLIISGGSLTRLLSALTKALPDKLGQHLALLSTPEAAKLMQPGFIAKILAISYIRYGFVFLRAFIIVRAIGLGIDTATFAQSFSLVRAVGLVALTPGSLGITEWSWTGVLTWFGLSAVGAAAFALTSRILNSLALVVVFLIVALGHKLRRSGAYPSIDHERAPS